jgi:hypothetical protein
MKTREQQATAGRQTVTGNVNVNGVVVVGSGVAGVTGVRAGVGVFTLTFGEARGVMSLVANVVQDLLGVAVTSTPNLSSNQITVRIANLAGTPQDWPFSFMATVVPR